MTMPPKSGLIPFILLTAAPTRLRLTIKAKQADKAGQRRQPRRANEATINWEVITNQETNSFCCWLQG